MRYKSFTVHLKSDFKNEYRMSTRINTTPSTTTWLAISSLLARTPGDSPVAPLVPY